MDPRPIGFLDSGVGGLTIWRAVRKLLPRERLVFLADSGHVPYGEKTKPVEEFNYEEMEVDAKGVAKPSSHGNYCWMNAAYVMGTVMTRSFAVSFDPSSTRRASAGLISRVGWVAWAGAERR